MEKEVVLTIVRDFEARYASAFNCRDVWALAALFTKRATVVTEWGDVIVGRAAFAHGLERAFAGVPHELKIENIPQHAVAITDDVIVSHGATIKSGGGVEERLVFTRVLVRDGERWRLASNQVAEPSRKPDPRVTEERNPQVSTLELDTLHTK